MGESGQGEDAPEEEGVIPLPIFVNGVVAHTVVSKGFMSCCIPGAAGPRCPSNSHERHL